MKKWSIFLSMLFMLLLAACGSNEGTSGDGEQGNESSSNSSKVLAEEDFAKMYSNPKAYKNYELTFTGKVFTVPEKDEKGTYLQVYADPENLEYNVLVGMMDPNLEVSEGDYIVVKGKVKDEFKGENMFGAEIIAPMVEAGSVEVLDYLTAVSPTLNSMDIQQQQNQHGLQITLEKIEFAKSHTRAYVKVKNNTTDKISLYTYSTKLVVGSQQYERESVYGADYPELQSDMLPSIESAGIITFPAIDPSTTSLKFYIEGSSDNWDVRFEPFVFEVE